MPRILIVIEQEFFGRWLQVIPFHLEQALHSWLLH